MAGTSGSIHGPAASSGSTTTGRTSPAGGWSRWTAVADRPDMGLEAPGDATPPGASTVEVAPSPDGDGDVRLRHPGLVAEAVSGHAEGWDYFLPLARRGGRPSAAHQAFVREEQAARERSVRSSDRATARAEPPRRPRPAVRSPALGGSAFASAARGGARGAGAIGVIGRSSATISGPQVDGPRSAALRRSHGTRRGRARARRPRRRRRRPLPSSRTATVVGRPRSAR